MFLVHMFASAGMIDLVYVCNNDGALQDELKLVLTDSKDFFPADFGGKHGGTYAGLFIRLAWHCAGSYRGTDGRGGCDGGRIRFGPEYEWPDNTNLDKALELLQPTYDKFSDVISWCDASCTQAAPHSGVHYSCLSNCAYWTCAIRLDRIQVD
jgi:catalase (peroxidase I)